MQFRAMTLSTRGLFLACHPLSWCSTQTSPFSISLALPCVPMGLSWSFVTMYPHLSLLNVLVLHLLTTCGVKSWSQGSIVLCNNNLEEPWRKWGRRVNGGMLQWLAFPLSIFSWFVLLSLTAYWEFDCSKGSGDMEDNSVPLKRILF